MDEKGRNRDFKDIYYRKGKLFSNDSENGKRERATGCRPFSSIENPYRMIVIDLLIIVLPDTMRII